MFPLPKTISLVELVKLNEEPVRLVKVPEAGVVEPIGPDEAKVFPLRLEALMVPEPVKSNVAPLPTTIEAPVLVPDVIAEKALLAVLAIHEGGEPEPFDSRTKPEVPGAKETKELAVSA